MIGNMEGKYLPKSDKFKYLKPDIIKEANYWNDVFSHIMSDIKLTFPISEKESCIDKFTGYYGYRWHPVKKQPNYFHSGIDINTDFGSEVLAISDGFFEYSGYHPINGNYILISHPNIKTEDNFELFSIYMHLESSNIRFNIVQKVLREIGLKKLTNKRIKQGQILGYSGDSGNSKGIYPHLHFQVEFRKGSKVIILDPCMLFGLESQKNLTSSINNQDEFKLMISNYEELKKWENL